MTSWMGWLGMGGGAAATVVAPPLAVAAGGGAERADKLSSWTSESSMDEALLGAPSFMPWLVRGGI